MISERARGSLHASVLASVVGILIIYLSGIVHLSIISQISIWEAVVIGALPFLLWDAIKIAGALIIADKIRSIVVIP